MGLFNAIKKTFGPIDSGDDVVSDSPVVSELEEALEFNAGNVISALGGKENIILVSSEGATRVRVEIRNPVDQLELESEGVNAVAKIKPTIIHLIVGLCADAYLEELRKAI